MSPYLCLLSVCLSVLQGFPLQDESVANIDEMGDFFEGDIVLPLGRNGLIDSATHWDNGNIPYELDGNFNKQEINMISDAMDAYHQHTCIRFVPKIASDENYITITSKNSGCWSSVGRIGGQQKVNLQTPGCVTKIGTVIHELMHAVGFTHEQNRADRDEFVQINWSNILEGRSNNFKKGDNVTIYAYGVPYDYNSVLHYSAKAFSNNNQPTIVPLTKEKVNMGQREYFSPGDIKKLRRMYNCKDRSASLLDNLI